MAKRIKLDKVKLVEVVASGLVLEVTEDNFGRVLVKVESDSGGRRILIKQHEEDARCIVYELDKPRTPHLTLV
ncbi:MAG: hypothetical protein B0D92_03480 [Spirochaeta sp. LUC14_002_19_P3]|nr:MAG: hypothetical protein B0D92_03480 [Spirochaeta sp. LUC14_002_19_P3]